MGACTKFTSKSAVGVVGLAYLVLAMTLITVACIVLVSYGHLDADFLQQKLTMIPGAILLVFGLIFALASLIACCAAINHNKCLIGMFLSVTAVLTVVAAVLLGFYTLRVGAITPQEINRDMTKTLTNEYRHENATETQQVFTAEIDFWQTTIQCCGVNNYTDYQNLLADYQPNLIPSSCCNATAAAAAGKKCPDAKNETFDVPAWAFNQGCFVKVNESIQEYMMYIKIALAVVFAVLMLGIIGGVALCFSKRERQPTYSTLVD